MANNEPGVVWVAKCDQITVKKVNNGYIVDLRGECSDGHWGHEEVIAPDLQTVFLQIRANFDPEYMK